MRLWAAFSGEIAARRLPKMHEIVRRAFRRVP
jgi:hypothetical protein